MRLSRGSAVGSIALGALLCAACANIGDANSPGPGASTQPSPTASTSGTGGSTGSTGGSTAGATTAGNTNSTAGNSNTTAGNTNNTAGNSNTTAGNSNSTATLLSSLDFEDGQLHDWALLNFNNQPIASTNTGAGSGVTTADAAHGTHSLVAIGGANFTDAVWLTNTSLFPITPNQLYVRFYIKLAQALADTHTTFALVDGTGGGATGTNVTEVRMGGQFHYLVANLELTDGQRLSGGNTGDPETDPGIPITPNTWYCMEILFDGQTPSMRTWLNSQEITDLAVLAASDWTSPPNTSQWMPNMQHLKLGWQSYGNSANTVYLDDVAVSHSRIGCL